MENWTNALLCQTDIDTNLNDHRCAFLTNQQSHEENNRLSSVFARSRDYPSGKFSPKGKRDKVSADAEKANKRLNRVDLRGKLRIPSVNLRPIQLVFSCPFYRSSTLTSRSSTLRTLIFPRKKHTLIKRMVRVLKISRNIIDLGLARALTILIISEALSCHSTLDLFFDSFCRSRFHGPNLAYMLLKSRIASDFLLSRTDK